MGGTILRLAKVFEGGIFHIQIKAIDPHDFRTIFENRANYNWSTIYAGRLEFWSKKEEIVWRHLQASQYWSTGFISKNHVTSNYLFVHFSSTFNLIEYALLIHFERLAWIKSHNEDLKTRDHKFRRVIQWIEIALVCNAYYAYDVTC